MPWEMRTVEKQREAFVEAVSSGKKSIAAVCREFGISRKTGYKWIKRAAEGQRLCDQSRCPHRQPSKTAPEMEAAVLAVRAENPAGGGRTIRAVLEAAGCEKVPSAKTCGTILKRHGMISQEESLKHTAFCRFEKEHCNQMWQTDFKGDFLLGDGTRCYPLTILDDHSRFSIRIEPKSSTIGVKESFIQAFEEYGLPDAILSDNGSQFAGFRQGITQFERYLMDLDILPIHGRIRHPQTQGKIERFHRTMKQEILCVRGNCDTEVDQMVLQFPILADYCFLELPAGEVKYGEAEPKRKDTNAETISVFATHGHVYHPKHLPPLKNGDILLTGHTHIPACEEITDADGNIYRYLNPGSVAIPKEESAHSYMIYENGCFQWKNMKGEEYMTWKTDSRF